MVQNQSAPQAAPTCPDTLDQDVYEVELLLDFISGRPDKHLSCLDEKIIDGSSKLSENEIITKFYDCRAKILSNITVSSSEASFILQLKDILNALATPARGLTIAFTIMFSVKYHTYPPAPLSRLMTARKAFPGFVDEAESFRASKTLFSWACLCVTILGAVLLWQALYGEQLATHFEDARSKSYEAAGHLYAALDAAKSKTRNLDALCQPEKTVQGAANEERSSTQVLQLCEDYIYRRAQLCAAVQDIGSYEGSYADKLTRQFLPTHASGSSACPSADSQLSPGRPEDASSLLGSLTIVSNYFLPILFGLSGSLTAFLRGLQEKVRDSILGPRDRALSFIRLPLGIVAGVAVGLFYNGSASSGVSTATSGLFSLSAAGIAFMAGYGAEAFFIFLDSFVDRTFDVKNILAPKVTPK